jgi:hypothetical protein
MASVPASSDTGGNCGTTDEAVLKKVKYFKIQKNSPFICYV